MATSLKSFAEARKLYYQYPDDPEMRIGSLDRTHPRGRAWAQTGCQPRDIKPTTGSPRPDYSWPSQYRKGPEYDDENQTMCGVPRLRATSRPGGAFHALTAFAQAG